MKTQEMGLFLGKHGPPSYETRTRQVRATYEAQQSPVLPERSKSGMREWQAQPGVEVWPFRQAADTSLLSSRRSFVFSPAPTMSKTALLFAGQGAQVVGMGKDLAQNSPAAKAWFDRANAALGYDLASICFNGPEPELTKTEHAQPGIFLVSWVAFELLKERVPALSFEATAGLSLGEFTALTAAGAMSFEDGLRVVRQRGRFMQEACDATQGGMAAIIGLDEAPTREVCAEGRRGAGQPELPRPDSSFPAPTDKIAPGLRAGQSQRRQARPAAARGRRVSFAAHGQRPAQARRPNWRA